MKDSKKKLTRKTATPPLARRFYRPSLETLEDRWMPGDTILGALISHGLIGTAVMPANGEVTAERDAPAGSSRAIVGEHLADSLPRIVRPAFAAGWLAGPKAPADGRTTAPSAGFTESAPAGSEGSHLDLFGLPEALAGPLDQAPADALNGSEGAGANDGVHSLGFTTADRVSVSDSAAGSSAAPERLIPGSSGSLFGRVADSGDPLNQQLQDALLTQEGASALGLRGDGSGGGQGSTGPQGGGGGDARDSFGNCGAPGPTGGAIAAVDVPSESATGVSPRLVFGNGLHYTLVASGDITVGSTAALRGDAQYQDFQHPRTLSGDGTTPVGLQVVGATVARPWGAYNLNHVYTLSLVGQGQPVRLYYRDAPNTYTLHHGSLSVLVYQGSTPPAIGCTVYAAPTCDTCSCSGAGDQVPEESADACGGDSSSQAFSEGGVRYVDGTVQQTDRDLVSLGYGKKWGQTRGWTNADAYNPQNNNGGRTVITQDPYLQQYDVIGGIANEIAVVLSSTNVLTFAYDTGTHGYDPVYFTEDRLGADPGNHRYLLFDPKGNVTYFNDFSMSVAASQQGRFLMFQKAYGGDAPHAYMATRDTSSGVLTQVQRNDPSAGPNAYELFCYAYQSGSNPYLDNVALQRGPSPMNPCSTTGMWTTVRKVQYTYYDGSTSDGAAGDLQSATIWGYDDNDPNHVLKPLDTTYYRYYATDTINADGTGGFVNALKYVVEPQSYARLKAATGKDPLTMEIPDSTVSQYADRQYVYWMGMIDMAFLHSVYQVTVQGANCSSCGGQGTFTYQYQKSSGNNPGDPNQWIVKTTETLPDGNTNTVYTNGGGEVLLKLFANGQPHQRWATMYVYDPDGRILYKAYPSAVITQNPDHSDVDYDQANILYQYLQPTTGLIEATTYYSSTTAMENMAGGVTGYVYQRLVQQGANATFPAVSILESKSYFAHTAGSVVVYPVATDTVYGLDHGTAMDYSDRNPRTTNYSYTWYTSGGTTTAQMLSMTVNPPVVTAPSMNDPGQNGPGVADADQTFYDSYGRPIWHRNSINLMGNTPLDGYIDYTAYDPATGAMTKTIQDVDYSKLNTAEQMSFAMTGWNHVTGGLHLVSQMSVDALGRTQVLTDPNSNTTYTVYIDSNHEVRTYAGWNAATRMPTGPTQVTREDRAHDPSYVESYTMSAPPATDPATHLPTGTEAPKGLQSLSRTYTNAGGLVVQQDDYFAVPDSLDLTSLYPGSAGTVNADGSVSGNYWPTYFDYDDRGRRERVQSPTGTINRTVYDGLGRVVSTFVGTMDTNWTDATGCNGAMSCNMVQVSANVYDNNGVGDSNLTSHFDYPTPPTPGNPNPADQRETDALYDWRDRQVIAKQGVQATEDHITHRPIFYTERDNLDEVIFSERYDGDGVSLNMWSSTNGVPDRPNANLLRSKMGTKYDNQGRVYQTNQYYVDQTTGAVASSTLDTNYWYDHRGNRIKTSVPGGQVTKTTYDGADRPTITYTTDGGYDAPPGQTGNWSDAGNTLGDNVFTQVETTYDNNGNPTLVATRQRFHDNPPTALGADGALKDPNTLPKARVSFVASFYDAADRLVNQEDLGTFHGQPCDMAHSCPPPPTRSDTVLVTSTGYGADAVQQVAISGSPPMGSTFSLTFTNVWTGAMATASGIPVTADAPTLQQALQGLGNIGPGGALVSGPARGPWLVRFAGGNAGLYEQTMTGTGGTGYTVGVATTNMGGDGGRQQTVTDPSGLVAKTDVDALGRTLRTIEDFQNFALSNTSDRTTEYTYDGDGNTITLAADLPGSPPETTRYNYAYSGTLVSSNDLLSSITYPGQTQQEVYTYDALGEAATKTDRNGTQHTYVRDVLGRQTSDQATALGTGVANTIRRLDTAYDTGGRPYLFTSYVDLAGTMTRNQVEDLFNGFGQLLTEYQSHAGPVVPGSSPSVQYAYSYDPTQMTNANYSRPVSMTYPSGRTIYDNYTGLDSAISRLTSITDGSPMGTTLEAETYLGLDTVVQRAHPEAGVNLSYINLPTGSSDAGDPYNGLDRFGRVVDQYWGPSGSPTDNVTYTYDRDGNRLSRNNLVNPAFNERYIYDAFNQLTQFTRGSHMQTWSLDVLGNWTSFMDDTNGTQARSHNLQNQITSLSGGAGGQTPGYDANGNTTHDEFGDVLTYDAWNRLVQVATGGNPMTVLAGYGYDALGRRVSETHGATTTDAYFSSQWQVLEEQVSGATTAQYVWSPVYVDALVERDAGGSRLYVQQDANFNVTGLVDTTGTVVERYAYDPYGKAAVLDPGTWMVRGSGQYGTSSYGWVYLQQGGRYDTATGLYNFRERDYSPTLGRWMQQDPISYRSGDYNLYGYDVDNPTTYLDPWGLKGGHHWFPQALERDIKTKCPTIRIDDFTSPVVQVGIPLPGFTHQTVNVGLASQKNPPSVHYYLTHVFKYNNRFKTDVLNKSKDCCELLERAFALMLVALADVGAALFNGSIVTTNMVSYTGTQNTDAKFSAYHATECCKAQPKPVPNPVPQLRPVPINPQDRPWPIPPITPRFPTRPWVPEPVRPRPWIPEPVLPVWPFLLIPPEFFPGYNGPRSA